MNWIEQHAIYLKAHPYWNDRLEVMVDFDDEVEYLLEMADLLDDTTFVRHADPKGGLQLLLSSLYEHAYDGERENWKELAESAKDVYIVQLKLYANRLEAGDKTHRPEPLAPLELPSGRTGATKTLNIVAREMEQLFGSVNKVWLAQLMTATTGNTYTRDRVRKCLSN